MSDPSSSPMPMISMVTGIISIPLFCVGGLFGLNVLALPLAVVGLVCGFMARSQQKQLVEPDPRAKSQAMAGIVTSVITLAMFALTIVAVLIMFVVMFVGIALDA